MSMQKAENAAWNRAWKSAGFEDMPDERCPYHRRVHHPIEKADCWECVCCGKVQDEGPPNAVWKDEPLICNSCAQTDMEKYEKPDGTIEDFRAAQKVQEAKFREYID